MSEKEDLRVKRTKKALGDAFIKLLAEKTFESITVNEMCDEAGVRRATFYKHYTDKFNFLTSYTHSLRNRFDTLIWKSEKPDCTAKYYVAYAKRIIGFINEHESEINNILKSAMFPSVMAVVVEQNYKDTCDRLRKSVEAGMKLTASVEVTASICAGGVASAIYMWLVTGKKQSADELAEEVGAVVSVAIEN